MECEWAGTGQLSEQELGAALVNGDYSTFDPHTVRMMIRYGSAPLTSAPKLWL